MAAARRCEEYPELLVRWLETVMSGVGARHVGADGERRTATRVTLARMAVAIALLPLLVAGCGTTSERLASEQLLVSDAVDRAVAQIDFRVLAGRKVYVDNSFVQHVKSIGFVNAEYVISSIRQHLIASGCLLQPKADTAEFVVEVRVGSLGTDSHEVLYGIPATNATTVASSLIPSLPALPPIPEIAVLKRNSQLGVAKLAVFAYERETGRPVWISGIMQGRSTAKDTWLMGAGPFQSGTIYRNALLFAGSPVPWISRDADPYASVPAPAPYFEEHVFFDPARGGAPDRIAAGPQDRADGRLSPASTAEADAAGATREQKPGAARDSADAGRPANESGLPPAFPPVPPADR
ncbi:MAG: hypothetical protein D6725_06550 [Planctomycetota bacterium]|nr:MAG: hypothetical protein D6725_06550 [Planctomycetota bacterium]